MSRIAEAQFLLGELFEATLLYKGETYSVDDSIAVGIISGSSARTADSIITKIQWLSSSLEGFPDDLRRNAAIIVHDNLEAIEAYRKKSSFPKPDKPITLDTQWQIELLNVADNARENAIGKGEILVCIMFPGLQADHSPGVDVKDKDRRYSVKHSKQPRGTAVFKLNGVSGEVEEKIKGRLKEEGVETDGLDIAIAGSVSNFVGTDENKRRSLVDACNMAVREVSEKHDFIFIYEDTLEVKSSKGIYFSSLDRKQAKVGIKIVPPSKGILSLPESSVQNEVSAGGVAGVTTPLGTDASGGKGGPGVRKGKGKSILDKNAKSQGKFWGGAKPVNEASVTTNSAGTYGYSVPNEVDFDGDGDTDIRNDRKRDKGSIYRGGNGDLEHNAKQIGRHFARAKVMDDTYEILQDLLSGRELTPSQTRRFKRNIHEE